MSPKSFISLLLFSSLLPGLTGCADNVKQPQVIEFTPTLDGEKIDCQSTMEIRGNNWKLNQLLFFIADVEVESSDGRWQSADLIISDNQTNDLSLLGINCANDSSGQWQLQMQGLESDNAQSLRFKLGVPFEENHKNPLMQPSPLNDSSMFWVWQTGHKFLRLEMEKRVNVLGEDNIDGNWVFHLGSTGCSAKSALRAPLEPCQYDNYETFKIPFPRDGNISFELSALLKGLELNRESSCQSVQDNPSCEILFSNLTSQNMQIFK